MLNFKLRKGEIATLLTLGLVVVGTLITLGTSLLVNNKKNIASNPKAAAPKSGCIDYSNYCSSDCRLDKPTYSCLADSSSGQKKWCCPPGAISALTPKPSATTPKPSGGENYPADDSCWLLKCWKGQKQMLKYAGSLKKNSMPLTSCQGGSPYSGGGWMVIGEDKANNALDTFNCEGNEEITLVPTKPPSKTCGEYAQGDHFCSGKNQMWCDNGVKKKVVTCEIGCKDGNCVPYNSTPTPPVGTDVCTKKVGFKCSSGGSNYTGNAKTFDYYKSTAAGCTSNTVGGSCYGTSENSCSTEWNEFLKSQCDVINPPAGGVNCTDADYTELADNSCGANGWCGPKQKKYKKSSNNTCTPVSQTNSEFKCKNESSCSSNIDTNTNNCERITCPTGKIGEYYKGTPSVAYTYYNSYGECTSNTNGDTNQQTVINRSCVSTTWTGAPAETCTSTTGAWSPEAKCYVIVISCPNQDDQVFLANCQQ
ncbi:MAG: hypothetical protein NUV58_04285 [Candidatus Roizmanbacteria bacterium]|nr:hypothetical protein [Candidatus Roizmanbacteria bacterium]